jgi:hypothetical protein
MGDDAPSELLSRRHQMFPLLSSADIARVRRFGSAQRFRAGDLLFFAGQASPGMFVVLDRAIAISQRDGLGNVVPISPLSRWWAFCRTGCRFESSPRSSQSPGAKHGRTS